MFHLSVIVSNVSDLLEGLELHNSELVDGRSDVVAVDRVLDFLQLPHAGHVGKPRLNVGLTWNLNIFTYIYLEHLINHITITCDDYFHFPVVMKLEKCINTPISPKFRPPALLST